MKLEECETCIKRKTVYCPISIECMATDDKPYYQNRIMLLEENQQLKDNWNKLREWLKEYEEGSYGLGSYETGLSDGLGDVIKKMQELEGSDSNGI